jgi:hypothetical protein
LAGYGILARAKNGEARAWKNRAAEEEAGADYVVVKALENA